MCQSRQHQQGFILMVVIVAMMMLALSVLVSKTGELVANAGRRLSTTNDIQDKIQKALISFTATYQRLPCPARPTGATNPGWPEDLALTPPSLPVGLNSTCNNPNGVVPWNALGLSQAQVTDEWGRLISYRVYDGSFGLTQDKGASALNCATNIPIISSVPPNPLNGLCDSASGVHGTLHSTSYPSFITYGPTPSYDKGLKVYDFGPSPTVANITNVAFVLISHGPSGLGGYMPNGNQMPMPASDASDYPNTQASPGFFILQAASVAGIQADPDQ